MCLLWKYFSVLWWGIFSDSTLLWITSLFLSYMSVGFFSALCSAILDPLFPCEKKHLPSVRKVVGISYYLWLNIIIQCVFFSFFFFFFDPMDCSLPGSSGHGIFQARILEYVAISFSRFNMVFYCILFSMTKSVNFFVKQLFLYSFKIFYQLFVKHF